MNNNLETIIEQGIHSAVLSQVKSGVTSAYSKILIKPFTKGEQVLYQLNMTQGTQVIHKNVDRGELVQVILEYLKTTFNQCAIFGSQFDYHMTHFKTLKTRKTPASKEVSSPTDHNRAKEYIITQDSGADFLVELGVIGKNGDITHEKYDKFRQINRYLEFIRDLLPHFPQNRPINVVDFGCGKAYLTFALYYYLTKQLGLKVNMVGLDLKTTVVDHCEGLARRLGYSGLHFQAGDIKDFAGFTPDLVISLHACDTATDEAILKGILWQAAMILAVPCCQHQVAPQLKGDPMLDYGIMRERLGTLLTDTCRGKLLQAVGYDTIIAEFIDMEHTPKNLLIKGVKGKKSPLSLAEYKEMAAKWGFSHHLYSRLKEHQLVD